MSDVYAASGFKRPNQNDIEGTGNSLGLSLSKEEIKDYADIIAGFADDFTQTANAAEPSLPVKYPRTPGYRPSKEENTHNAWYWKTDIKGAESGLLAGKKIAIKDNVAVAGVPMMVGSRVMEGYVPEYDATVVTRILDAGGTIIGKTVCEDLCFSAKSCTSATGPVLNSSDKNRNAGGSSSGSAVVVGLKEADMAIAGDQGGSIRIPSSFCGTVGFKPTFGLVPYTGAGPLTTNIDHLGPITRTVKDAALFLEVIAGPDGMDPRQLDSYKVPKYSEQLNGDIKGLSIAAIKEGFKNCEDDVSDTVKASIALLEKRGAKVEWISVPQMKDAFAYWTPATFQGTYKTFVEGDGACLGPKGFHSTTMCEHFRRGLKTKINDTSPSVKLVLLLGKYIQDNYGNFFYNKSQNLCPVVTKAFDDVLQKYDALYMPTLPHKADRFVHKDITLPELIKHLFSVTCNTAVFNYTGHPALTMNVGHVDGKVPIGGMIVGKKYDDQTVLNVAYALEQAIAAKAQS